MTKEREENNCICREACAMFTIIAVRWSRRRQPCPQLIQGLPIRSMSDGPGSDACRSTRDSGRGRPPTRGSGSLHLMPVAGRRRWCACLRKVAPIQGLLQRARSSVGRLGTLWRNQGGAPRPWLSSAADVFDALRETTRLLIVGIRLGASAADAAGTCMAQPRQSMANQGQSSMSYPRAA